MRQPKSHERIWLGSYDTTKEAVSAYDAAVVCLRGQSAIINFTDDPLLIPCDDDQLLSPSQIQVDASRHARRVGESAAPAAEDSHRRPAAKTVFFRNNSEFGYDHRDVVLRNDLFDSTIIWSFDQLMRTPSKFYQLFSFLLLPS